jgi:altronate hydrolase
MLVKIHARDNVAVALQPLTAGQQVAVDGQTITLRDAIGAGHKFALAPQATGDSIVKYGEQIGRVTQPILSGDHVHTHNLATALSGELAYQPQSSMAAQGFAARQPGRWQGYRRADGAAATRNEIWILPTVGCVGQTAELLARAAHDRRDGAIDGVYAFTHPHGCSQLGDDLAGTRALLAGLATNPNAAGVLLLGLGCESNQLDALLEAVPAQHRSKVRILSSQSVGDEMAAAARMIDELIALASSARREDMALSDLTVGLKCGGSDGFSGLTANPLLGRFTDQLTANGGRAILTEIPEIFGAEHALLARAVDPATFEAAAGLVNRFKRHYLDQGLPVSENPSPGNLAGGITTLEEKSLGAVQKGGQARLVDVLDYGAQAVRPGLSLLEAPGNDAVSSSALAAAGANLVLFTTGRGTPLGFPVPTVKVASNRDLAETKSHWIDFDASATLGGDHAEIDDAFVRHLCAIASGELTASERTGQRAIAIWKRGVTL